jgi:hypothetical protein
MGAITDQPITFQIAIRGILGNAKAESVEAVLIDTFIVPEGSKAEFLEEIRHRPEERADLRGIPPSHVRCPQVRRA